MHPLQLVSTYTELIQARFALPFEFEFSKYVYVPQTIAESREVFRSWPETVEHVFHKEAGALLSKEEIAFHSRVTIANGRTLHVPMIDMGCENIGSYVPLLKESFEDFGIGRFSIFSSGRSFHVYGHGLLESDQQLVQFMGRILLLNLPGRERVIDERWVGHRLMAGYSTLRWTNNNPHYKAAPTLHSQH